MNRFNAVTSALFDPLLAPFGDEHAWFDLVFWSVLGGIVALIVYKFASNQAGIARAKNAIKVHLLEIRLFKDDIAAVLGATARILLENALYLGHNILPMLVIAWRVRFPIDSANDTIASPRRLRFGPRYRLRLLRNMPRRTFR